MFSSNHDAIMCSLQDLPNAVIEAERGAVEGAIDLTSIEPWSMKHGRIQLIVKLIELTINVNSSYFCCFQVIFYYIKYIIVLNFSNNV